MDYFPDIVPAHSAFLAPMAGISDHPFRLICKRLGASVLFSEFVSADGLIREEQRVRQYLHFCREERPFGVQLFGSEPATMAKAARIVAAYQPDFIDLNFGCPAKKVVKTGAGAALLSNPDRLQAIAEAVVDAVSIPVTGKIRSRWKIPNRKTLTGQVDETMIEIAQRLENSGIRAVTVHAVASGTTQLRSDQSKETHGQKIPYPNNIRWAAIAKIKKAIRIPVIGNGGIWNANDAKRMLDETGCDAVMVARGARGNPWIFSQISHLLCTGHHLPPPTWEERKKVILTHLALTLDFYGESQGIRVFRRHLPFYLKGLPRSTSLRSKTGQLNDATTLLKEIEEYFDALEQ
ncbi:tRNA dihydrouridine synthase DusB [candidate division KSB1 bacterium]|nr:MAG: tRNA dihydrouridine synthase DusB [candidate division KSB1 bacterium]